MPPKVDSHTALHIAAHIRTTLSEQPLISGVLSATSLLAFSSHLSDDREDTFSMVSEHGTTPLR